MRKIFLLLFMTAFGLTAWSQAPERNMVTEMVINKIESEIGDISTSTEDQVITAWNKYLVESKKSNGANKSVALKNYQDQLKLALGESSFTKLGKSEAMKALPGFREVGNTN